MTPDDIRAMFTRSDGSYAFARWGRPIAPVVFGVQDETLSIVKGAVEAVAHLAGLEIVETDAELGVNLMIFFFNEWAELTETPDLDKLVPDLAGQVQRLEKADASQYRLFRFDENGAIRACFVFVRMSPTMSTLPAEDIALAQAAQSMLLWSDVAFSDRSPLAVLPDSGQTVLQPDIGAVINAAYDPVLPAVADDPTHALRVYARVSQMAPQEKNA
ncbi:hypothetical protein [Qingshengfaniella alkalisoli]|uniref:Uncharacterized protein n=1 Tax=Qingshengfaniella alkalisoli TaxID=2599296 RepID=A0A5B8IVN7_9RHOB|nr:hypothetical protein [Qingshengfaniella alkalisoli]QDY69533.1 hypothetical protein FPZ52_07805 [Qingshengfaniella alkalisoli]